MSFKTHPDKPAEVVRQNENAMQIVSSNFETQYAPWKKGQQVKKVAFYTIS